MRLILIRHGETDWNQQRRVQGLSDVELNERGQQQSQRIARYLEGEKIDAIYSSPLKRALKTAQVIAHCQGLSVRVDPRLQELNQGDMDGLTIDEMRIKYPHILRQWANDAASVKLPGGESLQDLQERVWLVVQEILSNHPQGVVVALSHNLAILSIICKAIGLDLSLFRKMRLSMGAISVLEVGEQGPVLVKFNDTCHLREVEGQSL